MGRWPEDGEDKGAYEWPTEPSELDCYHATADNIARVFDDYASQLEAMARTPRSIANQAEDCSNVGEYDFADRYPDVQPYPSEEERYCSRRTLVNGLTFLLAQVAEDLAKMDGFELTGNPTEALRIFMANLPAKAVD